MTHQDEMLGGTSPSETDGAQENGTLNATVATVVVVAAGAALFEAALLPGIAIGVAAVAAPKYLPKLAATCDPLFKSTVRGAYKLVEQSREAFAEAQEQVNDIIAEVNAETEAQAKKAALKDRKTGTRAP